MTDKEKLYYFADSIHTFCEKQRHIISGEIILLEQRKDNIPINTEQFAELLNEQYEMNRLIGKTDFMVDLFKHLNSTMEEMGISIKNN
jgi:hypothetical protein